MELNIYIDWNMSLRLEDQHQTGSEVEVLLLNFTAQQFIRVFSFIFMQDYIC